MITHWSLFSEGLIGINDNLQNLPSRYRDKYYILALFSPSEACDLFRRETRSWNPVSPILSTMFFELLLGADSLLLGFLSAPQTLDFPFCICWLDSEAIDDCAGGELRERKSALPAIFPGLVALLFVFSPSPSFRGFLPDLVYLRSKNKAS